MILATSILFIAVSAVNSQVPRRDHHDAGHHRDAGHHHDTRHHDHHDESPKPYAFSYHADLDDNKFGTGHISRHETADGHGRVEGSYSLTHADGHHTRHVDYVADHNGFRAHIRTNEPGTDNQNPADVIMESTHHTHHTPTHHSRGGVAIVRRSVVAAELDAPEIVPVEPAPSRRLSFYRRPGGRNLF